MSARLWLLGLSLSLCTVSCGTSGDREIPKSICGTPVDPDLTRPLVASTDDWHEWNRVDRSKRITAPCLILSGDDIALRLRFSWDPTVADLMYLAKETGPVSGVAEPRNITFAYKTIVGTDGAISTTPCKTNGGKYFTLTLQVPQIGLMDQTHRKDIEKFMRAYFPATLKTLGCR
ncbi:hypothetical protein ACIBO9_18565 [Streptomyces prunicolor]|uniref:hypothetical protein n=1 Tax=Streptomyces prunicolor TaxID=67348 RepID=UPI0037D2ABD6